MANQFHIHFRCLDCPLMYMQTKKCILSIIWDVLHSDSSLIQMVSLAEQDEKFTRVCSVFLGLPFTYGDICQTVSEDIVETKWLLLHYSATKVITLSPSVSTEQCISCQRRMCPVHLRYYLQTCLHSSTDVLSSSYHCLHAGQREKEQQYWRAVTVNHLPASQRHPVQHPHWGLCCCWKHH